MEEDDTDDENPTQMRVGSEPCVRHDSASYLLPGNILSFKVDDQLLRL